MKDTTSVKYTELVKIIKEGNGHIILIPDQKKESVKSWDQSPWIISLLIPIIVASFVAWLANQMNGKKNKLEIDKLREETLKLKKTFQPIVIGTLQSIQDKIITSKIDALKSLVQIRNKFTHHEQQYDEGDPITPDYDEYLNLIFHNFSAVENNDYSTFHDNYSYLFPDKTFNILVQLSQKLNNLNETKKSFESMDDPYLESSKTDRNEIEQIIKLFKEAIMEIRKDCHLDTSFIHDFIEENK